MHTLRYSYEKAGLRVADEPIPWNAEAVLVEALIQFPPHLNWARSDLQLHLPNRPPALALQFTPAEPEGSFQTLFRLPPLQTSTTAILSCRENQLGQVRLPFLSAEQFLRELSLRAPILFASLGQHNIACQTFVEGQCCGLSACGILTSPTSLLPITDWDLTAEFNDAAHDVGQTFLSAGQSQGRQEGLPHSSRVVALHLTSSQLLAHEALVTIVPPAWPRPFGRCAVRWQVRDRVLAGLEVQGISQAEFQRSLYLVEARYLYQDAQGAVVFSHHLPGRDGTRRLRPGFVVASRKAGMAALCPFQIRVLFRDPARPPLLFDQEVLVTDGPSLCLPGLLGLEDVREVRAFELLSRGQTLGVLTVSATPMATFSSEGSFKDLGEYAWTPIAEEELLERLQKLMAIQCGESQCEVPSSA